MMNPDSLYRSPNALASHYERFEVANRLLLTGHSHQAWPDVGFDAQSRAWLDAAKFVDDKWERAFEVADRVRYGWSRLLDDDDGHMSLASNTHELVIRFLSALPLRARPKLVTTDGEFHSIRRQLDRLEEEGVEIVRVRHAPIDSLAERLSVEIDERTAAALVSKIFYHDALIAPDLGPVAHACNAAGAELLVDVYHALDAIPFSLKTERLDGAFIVGGGYKYAQLGEGNCFMRFPRDCELRPVITGWFSEFEALTDRTARKVAYGTGGGRFAGATYDPASHYRGAAVFDFFERQGLTAEILREVSQHQIGIMAEAFDDLGLDPGFIDRNRSVRLSAIGGFLALESYQAARLCSDLRGRGVYTDFRANILRLGPAPYLSDDQLREAVALLGEVVREIRRHDAISQT